MELESRFQSWYPFFILMFITSLTISSTVTAEIWVYTRTDNFFPFDKILYPQDLTTDGQNWYGVNVYRSQGLTTDGQNWFFSWQYGLEKTTLDTYSKITHNGEFNLTTFQPKLPTAIPGTLLNAGSNHIGDIDYYKGKIYAPVEDGPGYHKPYILIYDANDNGNPGDDPDNPNGLSYTGPAYLLPQSDLTGGVPWVAVDGCSDTAFTAEWDPTTKINRYNLGDFSPLPFPKRYLMLKQELHRIQGAKVHNGALYASADDENKTIYKIDLSSGQVDELFNLKWLPSEYAGAKIEVEGLSFLDRPEGSSLHVLRIIGDESNLRTLHAALETYVLVPTIIPAFNVKQLVIDQNRGALFLLSEFALGQDSNGINPVKETVTFKIGGFTRMIPACSFRKNPYLPWFAFAGQIDNVWIEAIITPFGRNRFVFQALAYGAELGEIKNPVAVGLMIGDDNGTTTAPARTH